MYIDHKMLSVTQQEQIGKSEESQVERKNRKRGRRGRSRRGPMQPPGPSKGSQLCVKECLEQGKGLWMTGGNGTHREAALRARQKKVKDEMAGSQPPLLSGAARAQQRDEE